MRARESKRESARERESDVVVGLAGVGMVWRFRVPAARAALQRGLTGESVAATDASEAVRARLHVPTWILPPTSSNASRLWTTHPFTPLSRLLGDTP